MKEIDRLAELCGIFAGYHDIWGEYHPAPLETKLFILRSMGYTPEDEYLIQKALHERIHYPWLNIIEPVYAFNILEEPVRIYLYLPAEKEKEGFLSFKISFIDERGRMIASEGVHPSRVLEERFINNKRFIKIWYEPKESLKIGYYEIDLELSHYEKSLDGLRKKSRLIISPGFAYLPEELKDGRCWGLFLNLYSLRSEDNWGIGDFGDLRKVISWVAELGGSLIGINPLHALSNKMPYGVSPYSPLSRLYKNLLYLDMRGFQEINSPVEVLIPNLRSSDLIDYESVYSIKKRVLKVSFSGFIKNHFKKDTPLAEEFNEFLLREGRDLDLFATYMALSERFNSTDWMTWPSQYHDPEGPAVKRFKDESEEEILFFKYIQWLIDRQHWELCNLSEKEGLLIGLYHDLALSPIKGSSDVWSNRELFLTEIDLGAPPDDFSPDGQNWGFPALVPERLRKSGYEFFIKVLRKNMLYAGALRIDHALGLFRQFWIPKGMRPSMGVYVRFPADELLKIISLESVRQRTIVIAEDLGTIGEDVREALRKHGLFSYRIFYFERGYPDPAFLKPEDYPELSLAAVTTHDLPTLSGFWKGVDIDQRKTLGRYPDDKTWAEQKIQRQRDRVLIVEALKREGLLPEDFVIPDDMTEDLCLAIYNYIARAPSKILLVSLDDILGTINQQNMPGTVDTYPNWRQKTIKPLEEIVKDERFNKLAMIFQKEGRGWKPEEYYNSGGEGGI